MNIILFILILGVLIFVHELGHFLFAKLFKIRVDEFGFGYPPKMFKIFSWKGTDFTMNWIPFGGFVKIFGEADDGKELIEQEKKVSLVYKPRWQQILVMLGGIIFNIIFAWILFSAMLLSTQKMSLQGIPSQQIIGEPEMIVASVVEGGPAAKAGLQDGDIIKEYYHRKDAPITIENQTVPDLIKFIQSTEAKKNIGFVVLRDAKLHLIEVTPISGFVSEKPSIGITLDQIGEVKLNFGQALMYGAQQTWHLTKMISHGFIQLVTGKISTDAVSGPVGIAKQVGDAANIGFMYLISFTAMLSINLAILNLIPFPALDGGRIFILLIESVIGKRLNPNIVNWINVIGFFILIGLMLLVTVKDIWRIF